MIVLISLFWGTGVTEVQAGSGKLNPYSNEISTNFMNACTNAGASTKQCQCSFDVFRERFTEAQFIKQDTLKRMGKASDELANTSTDAQIKCQKY